MSKEEIEQVLIKYIEHVLEIEGTDFISEYYLQDKWNPAEFTEKEKQARLDNIEKMKTDLGDKFDDNVKNFIE